MESLPHGGGSVCLSLPLFIILGLICAREHLLVTKVRVVMHIV